VVVFILISSQEPSRLSRSFYRSAVAKEVAPKRLLADGLLEGVTLTRSQKMLPQQLVIRHRLGESA